MGKFNTLMSNISKGMLSKKMRSRADSKDYLEGAELVQNFLGYKQGGLYRRPGTNFLNDFTSANVSGPMIPTGIDNIFIVDSGGEIGIMFYRTGGVSTRLTALTPLRVGTDFDGSNLTLGTVLDYITVGNLTFITRQNEAPLVFYKATGVAGTVPSTVYKIHLATLPIDIETLVNPSTTSPATKTVLNNAYEVPNITAGKTATPSATSGTITITFSFKVSNSVGRYVKITHGATTGVAVITSTDSAPTSSSGVYSAIVIINFSSTSASDNWQLSVTHLLEYLTVHEQRIVYGFGERIFGTRAGNLQHLMVRRLQQDSSTDVSGLNYFGEVTSLDPFDFTIASKELQDIKWIDSGESLEIGTSISESIAYGGDGGILASTNVTISPQTSFGSSSVRPTRTNKSTISISIDGYEVREFFRSSDKRTQNTRQLNVTAEEIQGNNTFVEIAHQRSASVIWFRTSDEKLVSCVYQEEVELVSWSIHDIDGSVKAITPFDNKLFILVERVINSSTVQYVETIEAEFKADALYPVNGTSGPQPIFSDSSTYFYSAGGTTTVTGLSHLEGETVDVLVNGVLESGLTVASGQVTTSTSGNEFFVGLPFTSKFISMPIESGGRFGTSQGVIKRIHEAYIMLYRSIGVKMGDKTKTYDLNLLDGVNVVTQDVEKKLDITPSKKNYIVVEQTKSLPVSLLGIMYRGVTYDQ